MPANHGPFFHLPQPKQPAEEQNAPFDVEGMLRAFAAQARATAHAEDRRVIEMLMEMMMRVSELSSKVDALIGVANTLKATADAVPQGAASVPEDDPEVQVLADRIDSAIAVLQGVKDAGSTTAPSDSSSLLPPVDPNAPV